MRDSRRSVSLCSLTINSRVELLPQSSAATTSVTDVLAEKFRYAGFGRDEFAYGVARADEEVREVGVQALHADARAAHATTRLGAVSAHSRAPTTFGVQIGRA